MATDLTRIGEKARRDTTLVFTSLFHHICDEDNLRVCYGTLGANKAPGVDGVTKNYYSITDNTDACSDYCYHARRILYKWLNRKSQRKGYNWDQFAQVLDLLNWPAVNVRKDLNPFRREEAC